jgi:hypothetical protein
MTALLKERQNRHKTIGSYTFPLAVGTKAWQGGKAGGDRSTGKVEPMHGEGDLLYLGIFEETVDATSAEKMVSVDCSPEKFARWWANDGSIAITDRFNLCYSIDDQTVGKSGSAVAGRIWDVDSVKGVLVEGLQTPPGVDGGGSAGLQTLPAFAANAILLDEIINGAAYDVPTTAGASAITLPGDAPDGSQVLFSADGTKNGHAVTYRDETGDVAITTALTALKRHLVLCKKLAGTWRANAYVSP